MLGARKETHVQVRARLDFFARDNLVDFYFTRTRPMPLPMVFTVSDLEPNPIPMDHCGALRAINPDKILCAARFALL